MGYTIKYFGDTRMLSHVTDNGVEILAYTVRGLIDSIKAYKEIYKVEK